MLTIRPAHYEETLRVVSLTVSTEIAKKFRTEIGERFGEDIDMQFGDEGEIYDDTYLFGNPAFTNFAVTYDAEDPNQCALHVTLFAEHDGDDRLDGTLAPATDLSLQQLLDVAALFRKLIA